MLNHIETVVQEGFLCPICLRDYCNPNLLQQHFQEKHTLAENTSEDDKVIVNNLKDLFDRAKKIFIFEPGYGQSGQGIGPDSTNHLEAHLLKPSAQANQNFACYADPNYQQELGFTRNHWDSFKQMRDANTSRFTAENNKLIIRLNKLMADDAPLDYKSRKVFEQNVVNWVPDRDVPLCPGCGQTFGLRRRRHHCRLCGGVMCAACAHFMPHGYAKSLIGRSEADGSWSPPFPGAGFLQRSSSNSSLASLVGVGSSDAPTEAGDRHVRCCTDCRSVLERQERRQRLHKAEDQQLLLQVYGDLRSLVGSVEEDLPRYEKIAASIHRGECNLEYSSAVEHNSTLLQRFQQIDVLSRRLTKLGCANETADSEGEAAPSCGSGSANAAMRRVQQTVRAWAVQIIRDGMPRMRALPTEEEYRVRVEQRLQRLHKHVTQAQGGWIPSSKASLGSGSAAAAAALETQHPLLLQIENIRGYVAQARAAGKREEATMLEQNLRELQMEFGRLVREERERAAVGHVISSQVADKTCHGVNPFETD